MKKVSVGPLIYTLFLPLLVGGISAALSSKGMAMYADMSKPALSPPGWVFSVAWTILYIMMGLASYYVIFADAESRDKATALAIYGIQLAMNFMWSIFFFGKGMYLFAFVWLIVMWWLVIMCTLKFFSISKTAGLLLIPYVLWMGFAAYLNLGAFLLSRGI